MKGSGDRGQAVRANVIAKQIEFAFVIAVAFSLPASAQRNFGGIPPSVTSTSPFGVHAPPPLPSVTSIPNDNFRFNHFNNGFRGYHRGRGGYGYGYGYPAYTVPYYYPFDSSLYGSDYVGGGSGPDLYSGPPPGPSEPILHVIVEQPPASAYPPPREEQPPVLQAPQPSAIEVPEVQPGEPTLLVFRNGKHEEVTNYAIMGETLYVFDQGRKKIALADLDMPATMKANDDRGMEFRVPPTPAKKKAAVPMPQSEPDDTPAQPKKVAALTMPSASE